MSDNGKIALVADAMALLGQAWRMDWSDFDGRTLRSQLDELAAHLRDDAPFDLQGWAFSVGICPVARSWIQDCDEVISPGACAHADGFYSSHAVDPTP